MLQAMNTGHEGSLTTIHANTPRDALHRLEMLVLMGGLELPLRAVREQIASAFDLIIHLVRLVDGSRRVSRVTEVSGLEGDVVTLQDLFVARATDEAVAVGGRLALLGPLRSTGLRPNFMPKLTTHGVDLPTEAFQEAFA
jgi:pilus assembly protein CpaF